MTKRTLTKIILQGNTFLLPFSLIFALVLSTVSARAQTAEEYYNLGRKYYQQTKKTDSAVYYYTQSIKVQQKPKAKKFAPPYKDLGLLLFNGKKYEEADLFLSAYERITNESQEENDSYYYWYAKGFLAMNKKYTDPEKAIEYYNKSLKYKEDYPKTHKNLMDLYATSNPEKAIYHYEKAKSLDTAFDLDHTAFKGLLHVYASSNPEKAIDHYNKAKDLDPAFSVEYTFFESLAKSYRASQRYTKAIEYYEKVLEWQPNNIQTEFDIALIYRDDLKDYNTAEKKLNKLLEKFPARESIIVELGKLYYIDKKIDKAMMMFSKIKPQIMDFGSMGSKNTYSNREYCVANYYLTMIYVDKKDKQKATETLSSVRNYFGLGTDNISKEYNRLVDVLKTM